MQFWCAFDMSRFRSCFCAPGEGAQCGCRTCRRMFRKGSQSPTRLTLETPLGFPGTQNRDQENLRQAREGRELRRRASREPKSCLKASQRIHNKREMETQYSRGKTFSHDGKCQSTNGKTSNCKHNLSTPVCATLISLQPHNGAPDWSWVPRKHPQR